MKVPITSCVPHEETMPWHVDAVATAIALNGTVPHPIIITRLDQAQDAPFLVIDGMHRFAASQKLGLKTIEAIEVDYTDPKIELSSWNITTTEKFDPAHLMPQLFPASAGYLIHTQPWADASQLQTQLQQRKILLAVADKNSDFYVLEKPGAQNYVEAAIDVINILDAALDQNTLVPHYVANHTCDASLILRPYFEKAEVISRAIQGKIFPRKSTRHVIPNTL